MPVRMAVPKELVSGERRVALDPMMAERFAKLGATPVGGTPRQLGDFIAAETRKWQKVVKDSGAKVD